MVISRLTQNGPKFLIINFQRLGLFCYGSENLKAKGSVLIFLVTSLIGGGGPSDPQVDHNESTKKRYDFLLIHLLMNFRRLH